MLNVWKTALNELRGDPSFRRMFRMMEKYKTRTAAELTVSDGRIIKRSYAEYIAMAKNACAAIKRRGYFGGEKFIGLIYDTCMDWPVLMWGILMSGNIPLLINPGSESETVNGIINEARAAAYTAENR